MSDFISRSALIKKLREKSVKDEVNTLSTTYTYKELAYIICNMPTAYDVEKVVAELEQKRIEYESYSENAPDDISKTYRKGVMRGYEYSKYIVKDIVRKGEVE